MHLYLEVKACCVSHPNRSKTMRSLKMKLIHHEKWKEKLISTQKELVGNQKDMGLELKGHGPKNIALTFNNQKKN